MRADTSRPLLWASVILGIGIAAFFDGIVLHQLLGWHHMICQERTCHPLSVADLQAKNRADGWFHLGAYLVLIAGVAQLFRAGGARALESGAGRVFAGGLLAGAGGFNVIEGIVDHHILQIHHVRFGPAQQIYDGGFLAISAVLFVVGMALLRNKKAADGAPDGDAPRAAAIGNKERVST